MALIAITACRKLEDYKQAVIKTNSDVRVIDPLMTIDEALANADGLMLTGGDDVAPERYGEQSHPTVKEVAPERDKFELALAREARKRNMPLFGICRGLQVLNVAAGGSLVQDIASQVSGALDHKQRVPPHHSYDLAHEVWLEKDSLLARLMRERWNDADACEVNSRHHQSVRQLGAGLKVSATAPDGVIEAIEDPSGAFCLAVQWHPENFHQTGEFRPLFEGFADAARRKATA